MKNTANDLTQSFMFSAKENYLMSCDTNGKLCSMMSLSITARRKRELNNMHLMEGIVTSDVNGFPILRPYTGSLEFDFIPFSEKKRVEPSRSCVHFFEDDYKFQYATWDRLDQTIYNLRDFHALMCPDNSLFIEEDIYGFLNKQSIYRSRFVGACCQVRGYNVIPTASWGGADSFSYCFESLPSNSVIAICGVGIDSCRNSIELWEYGVRELETQLSPIALLIYGNERKVRGLSTPTLFIPPYVKYKMKGRKERV